MFFTEFKLWVFRIFGLMITEMNSQVFIFWLGQWFFFKKRSRNIFLFCSLVPLKYANFYATIIKNPKISTNLKKFAWTEIFWLNKRTCPEKRGCTVATINMPYQKTCIHPLLPCVMQHCWLTLAGLVVTKYHFPNTLLLACTQTLTNHISSTH
jgi:hypothetical protein